MKLKPSKSNYQHFAGAVMICGAIFALPFAGNADTSFTINDSTADAFLASGSAATNLSGWNFGAAGTLAVASASSTKGEQDTVMMFNTASAVSQFNTTYGVGDWTITGVTLSLASNFGTNGAKPGNAIFNTVSNGNFGIYWLANDSWVEGSGGGNGGPGYPTNSSVSFYSISSLLSPGYDSLGTYPYTPPGNNVYENYSLLLDPNLVSNSVAGGDVSFYLFAADSQISYLFNSRDFASNHPELTLTAAPVPEPGTLGFFAVTLGCFLISRRQKRSA